MVPLAIETTAPETVVEWTVPSPTVTEPHKTDERPISAPWRIV